LFYARIAGFIHLFAMALAIFNQSIVLGGMVVPGDAAATTRNILAYEGLFRLGIAADVRVFGILRDRLASTMLLSVGKTDLAP
jgi:hypothetical protein